MTRRKPEPDLESVFAPPPQPDPAHARTLEERLLKRFDTLHPPQQGAPMFATAWKFAVLAAVVLFGLGAASQAPADYALEVGKSVQITTPSGVLSEQDVEPLVQAISGGEDNLQVEARMKARPAANTSTLELELWGNTFPLTSVERTLREKFPRLATAQITVQALSGTVHSNLAGLVGEKLFHQGMSQAELDAAKAKIIAELRAQGVDGDVSVEVEDTGDLQRVKVRAEKHEVAPHE